MVQPSVEFVHLRIPESYAASGEALLRIVDQHLWILPAHVGYTPGTILGSLCPQNAIDACLTDPVVVVNVALLSLPFFQQSTADEIADIRHKPPRQLPCPHRQALVIGLAINLFTYEENMVEVLGKEGLDMPSRARKYLRFLETIALWSTDMHRRRRLRQKRVTPMQLKRASGTFARAIDNAEAVITTQWSKQMARLFMDMLIDDMRQTFKRHAPAGKRYSQLCIDHMVAVILMYFGLETTGTASQIAERFRKRLRQQKE